jgi:hypothetical protein
LVAEQVVVVMETALPVGLAVAGVKIPALVEQGRQDKEIMEVLPQPKERAVVVAQALLAEQNLALPLEAVALVLHHQLQARLFTTLAVVVAEDMHHLVITRGQAETVVVQLADTQPLHLVALVQQTQAAVAVAVQVLVEAVELVVLVL